MIHIQFDFGHDREETDLDQLNALLGVMKLENLELEEPEGYLCTTRDGEGRLLGRRYGLDEGVLHCTLARNGEGHSYRMDTFTSDPEENTRERLDLWRKKHPDRRIRYALVYNCGDALGYLVLHHESPEE